ncbi:OLC1v1001185C1 [Oldenlandia corymbosa var. corymbosa]|uniref:Annexin n=1 Tax=Oldenlandia corymbosa var. corymbosa TaxID=529605 RepID=A0AAV1D4L4_OLDCO|nr:OLC1v1001185C1 [Oldenlandia corymbosa var. corymbosa]
MATLICPEHPSPVADAEALRKAFQGWGTNEKAIVSILGHRNAVQTKLIRKTYEDMYAEDLVKRLESELSGDFELLVALASPYKYFGDDINVKLAKVEADILHDKVKDKALNDEEIMRIISTRSNAQIVATLNNYKDNNGVAITKAFKDDLENSYLAALLSAIRSINNPQKYYEKVLRNALSKPGTDEDALTRVIVTRAEKDLKNIKDLYYKRNSATLDHVVGKETSSHYKALLLALLGKED